MSNDAAYRTLSLSVAKEASALTRICEFVSESVLLLGPNGARKFDPELFVTNAVGDVFHQFRVQCRVQTVFFVQVQ
jgi:hypothetical protein